jgi:hypothetical protein
MEAAANPDEKQGAKEFDDLLFKHIGHAMKNTFGAFGAALTGSRFIKASMSGPTQKYYKEMTRLSRALAVSADIAMATLGGDLKRKEMISARLGDVLAYLYMASAALKKYEDEGRQQQDLDYVHYAVQHCLYNAAQALQDAFTNYPQKAVGRLLKGLIFPLGNHYEKPSDNLTVKLAESLMTPGAHRDRLTHLCYIGKEEDDSVGLMENAFIAMYNVKGLERKLMRAAKEGKVARKGLLKDRLAQALEVNVLTQDEVDQIVAADQLRYKAIQVDHFSHDFSEVRTHGESKKAKAKLDSAA